MVLHFQSPQPRLRGCDTQCMFQHVPATDARSPKSVWEKLSSSKLVLEVEALGGDVVSSELQPLSLPEAFSEEEQAMKQTVGLARQQTAGLTNLLASLPASRAAGAVCVLQAT